MEVEGKHSTIEEDVGHGGVTIESSEECRPQKVIIEKPFVEVTRHIKPLYVRAYLNGRPISKVLIDNGSTVYVIPLRMLRALGRSINDLIEIEVVVFSFIGEVSKTLGILPIDITICSKTTLSAFFLNDSTTNYKILLGRDWIHANWCVSSSLQQILLFWKGNEVELVRVDKQPFMAATSSMEARYYYQDFGPIKFMIRRKDGVLRKAYMDSKGYVEMQKEVAKLLKVTTIVPCRPVSGPIIEEIDDDRLLLRRKGNICNFHIPNESVADGGRAPDECKTHLFLIHFFGMFLTILDLFVCLIMEYSPTFCFAGVN